MVIIFTDKPSTYDLRGVDHVWFAKQTVHVTFIGERHVSKYPLKQIADIVDDVTYNRHFANRDDAK